MLASDILRAFLAYSPSCCMWLGSELATVSHASQLGNSSWNPTLVPSFLVVWKCTSRVMLSGQTLD